jgi:type IV pilus assembly protein PilB
MDLTSDFLKKILIDAGYLTDEEFGQAKKEAKDFDKDIVDVLIFKGLITEELLGKLVAKHLGFPYASIRNKIIPSEVLELIPEKIAHTYKLIPFKSKDKELHVAMEDPKDFEALEFTKRKTGLKIIPYFITSTDLAKALGQYKRNIKIEFEKIIQENTKKATKLGKDVAKAAEELPVIKILDTLLEYAIAKRASDIHIETMQDVLLIRFRIDGILSDIISLPREIQPAIIARVKILSSLKLDEHRIPQDGRFKYQSPEETIALRVSIVPSHYGENSVMRLLPETARPLSLEELGLTKDSLEVVQRNIKQPHGMILVTGPTGSGKTTTLYSILTILNKTAVKIMTIEDPVEYGIRRVNQTQIRPKAGLTFATGLRSMLRHDPDIIMVGEIRDEETADIAIHAALTGHLVLSTLHTNDAPGAIPRLLDMGAEGYLVASTVVMVIAQRLVRRICQSCVVKSKTKETELKVMKAQFGASIDKMEFYKGKGCEECDDSGYKGRVGLFEVFEVNDAIRNLTIKHTSAEEIKKIAEKQGMTPMVQDGLNKVQAGITTIEEIMRAVRE